MENIVQTNVDSEFVCVSLYTGYFCFVKYGVVGHDIYNKDVA